MEASFESFVGMVALVIEGGAALLIAIGGAEALLRALSLRGATLAVKKAIWLHFARSLVLALEFELAADIIRTSISPTWDDIGQLASIAAIRTLLNYFLERDIRELPSLAAEPAAGPVVPAGALTVVEERP